MTCNESILTYNNYRLYVLIKGAPEELFAHCKLIATNEGCMKISDNFIAQFSVSF